jgi:(1->4)-alpha-D-glucan 1-alpha-D-glucosylmutase
VRAEPEAHTTYRVQLTSSFGFDDAADIVSYLSELGVTHLYCSPYLQAVEGSTHGYDVVDHSRPNEELGGEEGRRRMVAQLRSHRLGQLIDIVPNHMAIGTRANRWWWDVLRNGRSSVFAHYFDIDWDPPEAKLRNRVLMAILGDHYGRVLEAGELKVVKDGDYAIVRYHEHQLPLAPGSIEEAVGEIGIDEAVRRLNSDCDALDALLELQNYRLAYWRTAVEELDYRRFFDIDTLVGLRTEDPEVFEQTHRLLLQWVASGDVQGLRIDHPDGLRDPEGYLRRLEERSGAAWLVVEKILEPPERLPDSWPVAGTTGYDFLNHVTGLLVDPAAEEPLGDLYRELTGEAASWEEVMLQRKHQLLNEVLAADLNRLTGLFVRVCERHRRYRDYTRGELRAALQETLACFPVYRTYAYPGRALRAEDARHIRSAIVSARDRRDDLDAELFGFLEELLLMRVSAEEGSLETALALRFQQLSGPVMAKGVEDTAFYNYNRLIALNEVGGDPGRFGISVEEFHSTCLEAKRRWPRRMLGTSTHDTKRAEDVRARLALLSEMPAAWGHAVRRWMWRSDKLRKAGDPPDRNIEYLLYQVLVGAWPIGRERVLAYAEKASREAKTHTSWLSPNDQYEEALERLVNGIFDDPEFFSDIEQFVTPLVAPGRVNSLAQVLLKLTCPGVPDIYQGTELWDLSLVDPDNRRSVDYGQRRKLLAELDGLPVEEAMERIDEGLPKMLVLSRTLELRRRRPEAFGATGSYVPIAASGSRAGNIVAFCRSGVAVTVVPRLVLSIQQGWAETVVELPEGRWRDVFSGEAVPGGPVAAAQLFERFPVALLEVEGS